MTDNTGQKDAAGGPERSRRWLWAAFIVSLSLNMLILGAAGAMMWMHGRADALFSEFRPARHAPHGDKWRKRHASVALARPGLLMAATRRLMRRLPRARRVQLRQLMRRHRGELAPLFRQLADARRAVLKVLREEPLDRAALKQALADMRAAEMKAREGLLAMMEELMAALTPRERRMLADIMERKARWRWGR